jgi:hypothetical protein
MKRGREVGKKNGEKMGGMEERRKERTTKNN